MRFAGETAALATATCWAVGTLLFATASRRLGSVLLNRMRLSVAAVLLSGTLLVLRGSPWPAWTTPAQAGWLALSGLIGFVIGDSLLFRALTILGPGRTSVIQSLAPVFTALIAWPLLGERLSLKAILGIAMTVNGVTLVLLGRNHADEDHTEGSPAIGAVCAVAAALCQAGGYTISKFVMRQGLDPLSATVVRVLTGTGIIWLLALIYPASARPFSALRDKVALWTVLSGAVAGPYLGVTLSLVALQYTQAGVAAAIIAFYPVGTIVLGSIFQGEKLTLRMMGGALLAVAGVVVLFLR